MSARIASGERLYAIGDIHGRLDLFARLIRLIRLDGEKRAARRTRIILIGDIVDRGPDTAPLVERLRDMSARQRDLVVLKGNHEEIMVEALRGDGAAFRHWRKFGGDATLRSWGVPEEAFAQPEADILVAARRLVPRAVVRWLARLPIMFRSRDFLFVHAGIRPGVALDDQERADLLWIGKDFLESADTHPAVIVHGHSIVEKPAFLGNRIALYTGSYRTGRLTAVGFEESEQWVLST